MAEQMYIVIRNGRYLTGDGSTGLKRKATRYTSREAELVMRFDGAGSPDSGVDRLGC